MKLTGLWLGMTASSIVMLIANYYVITTSNWDNIVQQSHDRLEGSSIVQDDE